MYNTILLLMGEAELTKNEYCKLIGVIRFGVPIVK